MSTHRLSNRHLECLIKCLLDFVLYHQNFSFWLLPKKNLQQCSCDVSQTFKTFWSRNTSLYLLMTSKGNAWSCLWLWMMLFFLILVISLLIIFSLSSWNFGYWSLLPCLLVWYNGFASKLILIHWFIEIIYISLILFYFFMFCLLVSDRYQIICLKRNV